jgi:hypothetical protein
MSPRSSVLLAVLLLTAWGCLPATRAGAKSSAAEPEYFEKLCVVDEEAEAFTVLVVRVEVEGVLDRTYRYPISKVRQALNQGGAGIVSGTLCQFKMSGISADNPFGGSGYNGHVDVLLSEKGATVSMSFRWTLNDGSHGSTKAEESFSWGKPERRQVEEKVVISASFEEPKKA